MTGRKPWAGRFARGTDPRVERFTASIEVDQRLARHDIVGSMAHVRMLGRQGIISPDEAETIVVGLREVWEEARSGALAFSAAHEDIHMAVEGRLGERIGPTAGKLHTARSRNDQVALDLRLFTREAIVETLAAMAGLQESLVDLAEQHRDLVLPGYTHLQRAQPVLLAHHLLAYFEMLERDKARFRDCYHRSDVLPLGSGALAGVPYPVDRESVARELGFSRVSGNSLDAVSDRDFVIEYQAAASICMMHLSRLAEEAVLWSSQEFGFIELDDAYATGSSIMPQKKNPDVAELVRGRTAGVYGNLMAILGVMKGLPLSYNRDLQEDKAGFFRTVDTLIEGLHAMAGLFGTLRVNAERCLQAAGEGYALATDLADYLAKQGLPFREAHHAVGRLVRYAQERGKGLDALSLEEYRQFSPLFREDVVGLTAQDAVAARDATGGTSPRQVAARLAEARRMLSEGEPVTVPELDPATF